MLAAQVFVLHSCVLRTQNAGKEFKFKIGAMAEKDEIVKVENWETKARGAPVEVGGLSLRSDGIDAGGL